MREKKSFLKFFKWIKKNKYLFSSDVENTKCSFKKCISLEFIKHVFIFYLCFDTFEQIKYLCIFNLNAPWKCTFSKRTCDTFVMVFADTGCGERSAGRHPLHHERSAGVSHLLADFQHRGCQLLCRKILWMREHDVRRTAASFKSQQRKRM